MDPRPLGPAGQSLTRLIVLGGPRTGKTTYANDLGSRARVPVLHADDVMGLGWSEASEAVSHWFDAVEPPWICEGVACARALRKWLARNPTGKPCDGVIVMDEPRVELSPWQRGMMRGCRSVWSEIHMEMLDRGVDIQIHGGEQSRLMLREALSGAPEVARTFVAATAPTAEDGEAIRRALLRRFN